MPDDTKPIDRPLIAFESLPKTTQDRLIATHPNLREELAAMESGAYDWNNAVKWHDANPGAAPISARIAREQASKTGRRPYEPEMQAMPTSPLGRKPGARRRVYAKAQHIDYADLERRVATYSMQDAPRYRRSSVNILVIPLLFVMLFGQLLQLPGKAVVVVANRTHKLLTGYTVEELR